MFGLKLLSGGDVQFGAYHSPSRPHKSGHRTFYDPSTSRIIWGGPVHHATPTGMCTVMDTCPRLPHCVGAWGNWSDCNTTCGGGAQGRNFSVSVPAYACGRACEAVDRASQLRECNTDPCPPPPPPPPPFAVDCTGNWSVCTAECETWSSRTWEETSARAGRGAACPTPKSCQVACQKQYYDFQSKTV